MTAAIPPTPLSPPQLAVIQAPTERSFPAPTTQPVSPRAPQPPASAASGRGRIIDIVV